MYPSKIKKFIIITKVFVGRFFNCLYLFLKKKFYIFITVINEQMIKNHQLYYVDKKKIIFVIEYF